MRRSLFALFALTACQTSSDDLDIDTDPAVLPTETSETGAPDTDDDNPLGPDDTGALFVLDVLGEAEVARGVKFEGWQAITARWLKGGTTVGKPKCIYLQDVVNWERQDPHPGTGNPIPAQRFEDCPGCAFSFTVVYSDTREVDRYPDLFGDDTDDTDDAPDVVGSRSSGRRLNCDTLVDEQGFVVPSEDDDVADFAGVGYAPEPDGDNDASTGWVYLLVGQASAWAPYAYTARFDSVSGQFSWSTAFPPYEYAWP